MKSVATVLVLLSRAIVVRTNGAMSAFASSLSDRDVAAVATFIRNTWDNAFGPIVEADVQRVRAAIVKK